ncbi:MAG: FecR domain-containing protein [Candidatus Aminicenantes bacterium]|nr:FecR domain-containing protein [Candidatus Aminicenantes bacterium]
MKKLWILAGFLVICIPQVFPFQSEDYYDYSFARMTYVKGDVFVERADKAFEEGSVNLPLVENDKLGTREGRAEVHFANKNYLRLDSYTHVDLVTLPRKGDDRVKLNILSGRVYLRVSYLEREKDFEIHTPDASFYVLDEGLYGFRVADNAETEVHVLTGTLEAAGEQGSLFVNAEEKVVASNGYFPSDPTFSRSDYSDNFAQWNSSRDELLDRRVQKAYLPQEMSVYEEELAYNGDWVYEYPYGNVWVPRVYHPTWRPYNDGRWVWYALCGWSWVPYEPWGWCVSHYGRWHWRFGLGWYWIPTYHWGPAWVHWYSGYDYIGWCPVSYYGFPVAIVSNRFYGRGYGQHYPLHSRALTMVHRNQLQAPRISKVALSQSHVQRLGKVSLSAHQPKVRYSTQNNLSSSKAAKVLARSNIRKVGRNFAGSSSLESSRRARTTAIRGSTKGIPGAKAARSSVSNRSGTQSTNTTLRSRRSPSSSRFDSAGARGDSPTREARSLRTIRTYPSRQASGTHSRSYSSPRESQNSSEDYRGRTSVKSYGSQNSSSRYVRGASSYSQSRQSRRETADGASYPSSSVRRYSSRYSYSASSSERTYGAKLHSPSGERQSYQSRRPSVTFGHKSSYRYPSSSSRSSSSRVYGTSKSTSRGKYYSPRQSSSSRSYSKSRSTPSSTKSYSRGRVSSSKSSSSRVGRSSSSSKRSSSSSSSRRRK